MLLITFNHVVNLLINHGRVTSSDTVCQVLLYCTIMQIVLMVVLPRQSQGLYGELSFLMGQLCTDQISFAPLPPSNNPP